MIGPIDDWGVYIDWSGGRRFETLPSMTFLALLFLLLPILMITPIIMVIVVKTRGKTIAWSIVLHLAILLPATWIWAIISWGGNDGFYEGMLMTFLACSLYCAPFIIHRSIREKKLKSIAKIELDF